jgi:hypothetical protein
VGVGQQLTFDDTTATSLFLTNEAVSCVAEYSNLGLLERLDDTDD